MGTEKNNPRELSAEPSSAVPTPKVKKSDTTSKTFAILGIICGGIAFIYYPIYFGPVGLILGIIALRKGERQLGWNAIGLSIGGFLIGYILGFLVSINQP